MSFRSLGRESFMPQRFMTLGRRLRALWRGPTRNTSRLVLSAAAIIPFLMVWYEPTVLMYASFIVVVIWLAICYRQWAGWQLLGSYIVGGITLLVFLASVFVVWLFLENDVYRVLLLGLVVVMDWWYIGEWHRVRATLFVGEAGAGAAPTLAVGFISSFCLTAAAESFLVYLTTPVWELTLWCFGPIVLVLLAFVYASGWSLMKRVLYWVSGIIILLQVFLLGLWWPASSYVIGFTVAIAFVIIALTLRQEAQGFINRRSFIRELVILLIAWSVVLLGARWF